MTEQNKAIVLTAWGSAAIAVVRLVGPLVGGFLQRHFSKRAVLGRCVHGILADGGQIIDDAVVVLVAAGIADVNLHGGPWVIQATLDLAGGEGFQVIGKLEGPLPQEACDGRTTLEQEVQGYLPLARTELAVRVLLRQVDAWDAVKRHPDTLDARSVLADESLHWLLHPPRVAIIGQANVGKSTLANQLFGQERSITAELPGTTRDWVGEMANIDGLAVMLVDTPGVRQSDDCIEQAALCSSAQQVAEADLLIVVLDATVPLTEGQRTLVVRGPQAIHVVNKTDLSDAWREWGMNSLPTVATTGEGVDALRGAIAAHFGCESIDISAARWWTARQRDILERAVNDRWVIAEL